MSDSPRHRARELVLQALYAVACGPYDVDKVLESVVEDEELSSKQVTYAKELFTLVSSHLEWADSVIKTHSINWKLERIAIVDRNILRLALVELEHCPDVPAKVVINEAIELAKTFSTKQSFGFVNGILDNYLNRERTAES